MLTQRYFPICDNQLHPIDGHIDMIQAMNISQSNTSTETHDGGGFWATVEEFGPAEIAGNYFLMCVCIVTVFSDSIALYIVSKGKRLPHFCRILSMSYLISDLTGSAIFSAHGVLIYVCGYTYDIVLMSRVTVASVSILVSTASITLISVERVMALVSNITHKVPSDAKIIAIIVITWLFNTAVVLGSALLKLGTDCEWGQNQCFLFDAFSVSRYVVIVLMMVYDMILIVCNIIIQQFVRRHVTQIAKQQSSVLPDRPQSNSANSNSLSEEEYEIWRVVAQIIMSYFVLHIPMTVGHFIHEWYSHLRDDLFLRSWRITSYLCVQISSFVHLYLYVFKMKENKLNLYILLSRMLNRYKPRAEQLRYSVYNIPVAPRQTSGL